MRVDPLNRPLARKLDRPIFIFEPRKIALDVRSSVRICWCPLILGVDKKWGSAMFCPKLPFL